MTEPRRARARPPASDQKSGTTCAPLSPAEAEALIASVPLDGPLCEGREVSVGWPLSSEFDRITSLRNDPHTRRWFLDSQPLELEANRIWLASGMRRPYESVLVIRWKRSGLFLGSIGWMDWEPANRRLEIGRLMVDRDALRRVRQELPADYEGVARDAGLALGRFVADEMAVRFISFCYLRSNWSVKPTVELGELRLEVLGESVETRSDGRILVRLETRVPDDR